MPARQLLLLLWHQLLGRPCSCNTTLSRMLPPFAGGQLNLTARITCSSSSVFTYSLIASMLVISAS